MPAQVKIIAPKTEEYKTQIEDFATYSAKFLNDEKKIFAITVKNNQLACQDFNRIDLSVSLFDGCNFATSNFEKGEFNDVIFKNCDFSNCNFQNSYFSRCRFESCKGIGANFSDSVFKNVTVKNTNFSYALFEGARKSAFYAIASDFQGAIIANVKLENYGALNCKFIRTNFCGTTLKGINFSENILEGFVISEEMKEIKGCIVNALQAVEIAKLLGVKVSD